MSRDPIDLLREEDPTSGLGNLEPSLARIRAHITESISEGRNAEGGRPRPQATGLAFVYVGVLALAVVGVLAKGSGSAIVPPVTGGSEQPRSASNLTSCVSDPTTDLDAREYVFVGTVTRVTTTDVEFAVEKWVRGPGTPTITLRLSPGYGGGSQLMNEGIPLLRPGTQWRVAGDGGFIWGCGFTVPAATN